MNNLNFFRYNSKINSAKVSSNENLHPYRIAYIRFIKIYITSQSCFPLEYCVTKSMSNIYKENFWNQGYKKGCSHFFLRFHMTFMIFFQNSALSIINGQRSLAKRLRGKEQGLGEPSGLSHPLKKGSGWGLVGLVTASHV